MPDHLLDIALACAKRNWFVFPLWPRSKLPLISKKAGGCGFHDATLDEASIRAWWAQAPDANVGIATGASGLVVLDVDGPEGVARLKSVAQEQVPRTFTVKTGRTGGVHLYYAGSGISSSIIKGQYLDVLGRTGYVLAPGSVHENGTIYTIALDLPVASVPAWVGPWVRSRGNRKEVVHSGAEMARSAICENRAALALPTGRPATLAHSSTIAQRALRALQASDANPCTIEEINRLRSALAAIPADIDGRTWVSFGAALCDLRWVVGGSAGSPRDVGLEIWDEWSRRSEGKGRGNGEYRGHKDLEKRWRTFQEKNYQGARATVGSIYAEAQRRGWPENTQPPSRPGVAQGGDGLSDDSTHHVGANGAAVNGVAVPQLAGPLFAATPPIIFPDVNRAGRPVATCRNARLAIRGLGISCSHDAFRDRCTVGGEAIEDWAGELTDNTVHRLRVVIEAKYKFDPGSKDAHDAAIQECLEASHDPVLDYLDGLEWDGVPRLKNWLVTYLGAQSTEFNCAVGSLILVAAVRRAREPGCKFDQIVVLEGLEGTLKSGAIKVMAGDWFSDQTLLGLGDQKEQEAVSGVWLYEIADLAGHKKWEVERMKAFASRTHDRARPAYGRRRVDQARRCVFFATTNNERYLQSQTGNRRFWPVKCGRIDLASLRRDRDQLWAESSAVEERGTSLILPESLWSDATALQSERLEYEPWDDLLSDLEKTSWAKLHASTQADQRGEWRIATRHIMENVLGLNAENINDASAKRLVFSLRRLGWDGPKIIRFDNGVGRGYTKGL